MEETSKSMNNSSAAAQTKAAALALQRTKARQSFFDSLKQAGDVLSAEELSLAIQALELKAQEQREKENEQRRKLEEEQEHARQIEELRRREEAAKLAAEKEEAEHMAHVAAVTAMDLPMDWENPYDEDERAQKHADSAADGLLISLDTVGGVDIPFIAAITGMDYRTVIEALRGSIYQNPEKWEECFYQGWETADAYLSGNLMQKLHEAQLASREYNGYFDENVKALESLISPKVDVEDIYVTLGSPWVPTDIIDDFILHLIGKEPVDGQYDAEAREFLKPGYSVRHDEFTGIWEIPHKTRFRKSEHHGKYEELNYSVYGTARMDMLYLLESVLNGRTLNVTDTDNRSKSRTVNRDETLKLLEKQERLVKEFQEWVWQDKKRRQRLQDAYCRRFGSIRKRVYDGRFLTFPGMSGQIELYPHQKDAVARILMSPNTLLAHDVGAGKTYVMVAAGMELRRLHPGTKNLYVVPNNILGQWREAFGKTYPHARLLIVDHRNFNMKKREDTLRLIKEEDFDAILMTYSCFDMLAPSQQYYEERFREQMESLEKAKAVLQSSASLSRKQNVLSAAMERLRDEMSYGIGGVAFDELGINTLFVDEAHNYKNVGVGMKGGKILGGSGKGSERAKKMMDKVHCVQRMNNGGRVVLATGTPITNSVADIFVMQKYLQEGELHFLGLETFEAWAGMFAEKHTDFEIDVDTNSYHLATRFSRFCNLPELTAILSSIADFHHVDTQAGVPQLSGYDNELLKGSRDFKSYLQEISERADDVRQHRVKRYEDNLLKITSDGRKAALDMRLIDEVYGLDANAKVLRCAENIMEVYEQTRKVRGTQLVFCDSSTPKQGFNLYDELKRLLIAMGMPKEKIAFVHDADTEATRAKLFRAVQDGDVSVLVGSTFKMGLGVNVQHRLAALHHLDVPWRPADMVQREGRILRQGNRNASVRIFRYITKNSFDAYSWQLLETKQRFISQILSGSVVEREAADVDEAVLSYGEVKALAVGNPLIKKRVELANELDKYRILQNEYHVSREQMSLELDQLPAQIRHQEELIRLCEMDIRDASAEKDAPVEFTEPELKAIRERIFQAVKECENLPTETKILTYRGFDILVPAHMIPKVPKMRRKDAETVVEAKPIPYVWLRRNGTHYLAIESRTGITKRLNNFLFGRTETHKSDGRTEEIQSGLETMLEAKKEELLRLQTRRQVLEKELATAGGYAEQIRQLRAALDEIDEELGVKAA